MSKRYILRKPVTMTNVSDDWVMSDLIYMSDNPGYVSFNPQLVEDQFVEFDGEQLKQQLIELLKKERPILPDDFINTADLADEIMSVCFGEETNK